MKMPDAACWFLIYICNHIHAMRTQLIRSSYLDVYRKKQKITLSKHIHKINEEAFNETRIGYYASCASAYSSMIEGDPIDFDSYLKYAESGMKNRNRSFFEIEDLNAAYGSARKHDIHLSSFVKAHAVLSKTLISDTRYRGKIRDKDVYVYGLGVKRYTGTASSDVEKEMKIFFNDIAILTERDMSITEVFYFAAMIHLVFVQIHPFADGNGRAARLQQVYVEHCTNRKTRSFLTDYRAF